MNQQTIVQTNDEIKQEQPKTFVNSLILQKDFFTKTTCFKVQLNKDKECYFHWGLKTGEKWGWVKVKVNDSEIGEVIRILDGKKPSIAFFHQYNGVKRQIWVSRKEDKVYLKVTEMTKSLTDGEQEVLSAILKHIIVKMCYQ